MNRRLPLRPLIPVWSAGCGLAVFWCLAAAGADTVDLSKLPPAASRQVDFSKDIKPIFDASCIRCHGPIRPKSAFRLDTRANSLKGGDHGVDIVPGRSAGSPLIHYVANLVADMQMPPDGKGEPLTPAQVGLLRAWIDQGAAWEKNAATNEFSFSATPAVGGTTVSGNKQKFSELTWQPAGVNGGYDHFEMIEKTSPGATFAMAGHMLRDDYKLNLSVDRTDLGFIHAGWDQFRKYYSDTGGYAPSVASSALDYGRDIHLDIGKAWVDFGLELPHWPRMTLGYEYDYRQGDEAMTDWGLAKTGNQRGVAPTEEHLNETVNVLKFSLDDERAGVAIEERFRGEFYNLQTHYTNTDLRGNGRENVSEGNSYFQGANTIRLEKKVTSWFFASGGYLFSQLNSDGNFTDSVNHIADLMDRVPSITLQRQSHVFNANGLMGPFHGLTLSAGVQAEWTSQHGFGGDNAFLNPLFTNGNIASVTLTPVDPAMLSSDYDEFQTTETVGLRYNTIPYTALFADAKLQQETLGQFDQDLQPGAGFTQNTQFANHLGDVRAGFNTSPWQSVSFTAHYRRYEDDSRYQNDPGLAPPAGYPGFIEARNMDTDEIEAKLAWHPWTWLRTSFTYQRLFTRTWVETDASPGASPGGGLVAGENNMEVYSLNTTFVPRPRLFLSTTVSFEPTTAITADNSAPEVAVYSGNTYSILANATYALNRQTDLFATYSFSEANFGQHNAAVGLPVGIEYDQHALQAGVNRRIGKNVTLTVKYGFYTYAEPTSAGANNFTANSIFALLTYKWR
ncbi:MAG TPA: c-type cytochrome domain-containing protein [Verrucomicrobiae bacterium]|jgi:hypothetical protein